MRASLTESTGRCKGGVGRTGDGGSGEDVAETATAFPEDCYCAGGGGGEAWQLARGRSGPASRTAGDEGIVFHGQDHVLEESMSLRAPPLVVREAP